MLRPTGPLTISTILWYILITWYFNIYFIHRKSVIFQFGTIRFSTKFRYAYCWVNSFDELSRLNFKSTLNDVNFQSGDYKCSSKMSSDVLQHFSGDIFIWLVAVRVIALELLSNTASVNSKIKIPLSGRKLAKFYKMKIIAVIFYACIWIVTFAQTRMEHSASKNKYTRSLSTLLVIRWILPVLHNVLDNVQYQINKVLLIYIFNI